MLCLLRIHAELFALLRNSYGISHKAKKTQNVVLSYVIHIKDNTAF